VFKQTTDLLAPFISEDVFFEIGTTLMEAFSNALYHGVVNAQGAAIYEKGCVVDALLPHQTVNVSLAINETSFALSITDQGGRLCVADCLFWLERNVNGEGLFDTGGRGLFLMHCLMDRVLVNIVLNQQTTLFVFKEYGVPAAGKPLAVLENKPLLLWEKNHAPSSYQLNV
jgi:anti-sigma regulatory factor (Ser/Thr protein kinase)